MTTAKNAVFIGLELENCHQQEKPCKYIYIYIYIYICIYIIYIYKYILCIYIACDHKIIKAMQFAETRF